MRYINQLFTYLLTKPSNNNSVQMLLCIVYIAHYIGSLHFLDQSFAETKD